MRKGGYTEAQIVYAACHEEQGTPVAELCRKMGLGSDLPALEEALRRDGRR